MDLDSIYKTLGLPLREVVSWNIAIIDNILWMFCLPLREVVSWNKLEDIKDIGEKLSTSAWGSELKYLKTAFHIQNMLSTSAWGSELKWIATSKRKRFYSLPLREVVSWNHKISEREAWELSLPLREVVSWNIYPVGFKPVIRVYLCVR